MSFVAIFIAVLLERFFDCSHLRNWNWYTKLQRLVVQKLPGQSPYVLLAGCIVPVFIALAVVDLVIYEMIFGFIHLVFSVIVLLYCFGPRNLWADSFACINALSDNDVSATEEKLKVSFGVTDLRDPKAAGQSLLQKIFMQANARVFAIMFWYSITGFIGVIFYRLVAELIPSAGKEDVDPKLSNAARMIESYMDWPAVRFFTLLFALGGNFSRVFTVWRSNLLLGTDTNDFILTECGNAALNSTHQDKTPAGGVAEKEAVNLIDRSLGIMLVVIFVLVFIIP